jgi:NADH-quinone oxidoreductase subunit L
LFGDIPEAAVWAIFFLPVISLGLILFLPRSMEKYAGHIAATCIGIALLLALWMLDSSVQAEGHELAFASKEWLSVGNVSINVGLNVDGLAAIMAVVVTTVSFLVQIYSQGYMHGDTGYWRYFAYMSLFTASMLGLILMNSLLMVYVFWEMVGVSSFLLIGFWFDRPAASAAAKKAFLVTRLGDIGFLLAIILVYSETGTFDIHGIQELAIAGTLGGTTLTLFALGIFAGAAGKSAQVPFQVWLPDAMEGPTPVSALVHSATMVAAGVYLVARMFPVFHESTDAMLVVGIIGGITAIGAAFLGVVMTDIKRVLAYSTISQLGYMMFALGSGAYVAAIFHLMTHAFFKALLFLGSGSVNHATNTFDMRLMGGLRKAMPVTFWTFLIGSLSLSGIFPFAGFWSKDEILGGALDEKPYLFWIGLISAGLTAFYMFRVIFMTFFGEYRGGAPLAEASTAHGEHTEEQPEHAAAHGETHAGLHESPFNMAFPMLVLAVLAIVAGVFNLPWKFLGLDHEVEHMLIGALPDEGLVSETDFRFGLAAASTAVALGGIFLAYVIYGAKIIPSSALARLFRPLHVLLENKYYADVLYERIIVGFLFYEVLGGIAATFDRVVVDGVVNGVGQFARGGAGVLRYAQSGQYQTYGAIAFSGVVFTAIVVLVLSPL